MIQYQNLGQQIKNEMFVENLQENNPGFLRYF